MRNAGGELLRILKRRSSQNSGYTKFNFREFLFRDCMKRSQVRARRLVMRRIIAAYTNASPLAQSLS